MEQDNKNITKQEVKDWTVEVQEDGSVKVKQTIETEYTQSYRDFLSDYRQMHKNVEKAKEVISEDYKKKVKSDIEEMNDEIEKLKPYVEESEKKALEHNQQKQLEGKLKKVKEELAKPRQEINTSYLAAIWDNIRENETKLVEMLSEDEKKKFQEIKMQKVKQEREQRRAGKKKE